MENMPRIHDVGHPRRDSMFFFFQKEFLQCEPEQFNDRIVLMSMYNDIVWGEKGNTEECVQNSRFPRGRWSLLGPGSEVVRDLF